MSKLDSDDALDAAYRRASEADAGRPGAAVRARIFAEAQAAARRNEPAANQSRYWMGAVAGVAVLGFSLLMWRQVDAPLPGEMARTVTVEPVQESAPMGGGGLAVVEVDARAQADTQLQSGTRAEGPERREQLTQANQASSASTESRKLEAEESALQSFDQGAVARAPAPVAQAADNRAAAEAEVSGTAAELVRRHFPDQYQSTRAHRLWLVRDARNGEVIRVGEFQGTQSWDSMRAQVEAALGNRSTTLLRLEVVRNARGQTLELALVEAR